MLMHLSPINLFGIPLEFFLFGLILLGVALLHHHTLKVSVIGLAAILIYKVLFTHFHLGEHLQHEGSVLLNLFGLLLGFAILAAHFESSRVPDVLPHYLPDDWKGGLLLLLLTFIISAFLDNIAAAMIGGTIAMTVYKGRVHLGFLAALVAASNAGGAGSVVGDTTTTMMWIEGVNPLDVTHAYIGSFAALIIFGVIASIQQDRFQSIERDAPQGIKVDTARLLIVLLILVGAVITNIVLDLPAVGVWAAIFIGAIFRKTKWKEAWHALPGSIFLLCLVFAASMMPVNDLPKASAVSAFVLGFVSSVFDNIPLTKLALTQGGYDWGVLAFSVGFGGSMVWFGSSAGVALTNLFPEGKSVFQWLKNGWHVLVAYIVGFGILLAVAGWRPHATAREIDHKVLNLPAENVGDSIKTTP